MRTLTGNFFESKVRHESTNETGTQVKINELFVVNAMSFTECESKVMEYISQYINGEFEILTEAKAKYKEIFFSDESDEDKFYKCQLSFITLDERSGKEKRSKVLYLVQGSSIDSAKKNLDEVMSTTMIDYVVDGINESAIVDYIE